MSTRIAIIGAGGQIGRTLLTHLTKHGLRAVAIVRNELTASPLRLAGFEVRNGEVTNPEQSSRLIGDCDVVVNCASSAALWGGARAQDRATLDALLTSSARRLIHFSSVAVYGTCVDRRHNTFDRPRPDQPYGRDKLSLERHLWRRARTLDKRIVVLRMGHVYGAEQWLSRFVFDRAKTGFRLPFDGQIPSNAIHVSNVASAVRTLIADETASGTFNLFDPGQSTWRQVFDWNTNAVGLPKTPALDTVVSERARERFRKLVQTPIPLRVAREVGTWMRGAPFAMVSASPSLRDLLLSTMSVLRSAEIDQRLVATFSGHMATRVAEPVALAIDLRWIVSDEAPGEALRYPAAITTKDAELVASWYRGYSRPEALGPTDGDVDHSDALSIA